MRKARIMNVQGVPPQESFNRILRQNKLRVQSLDPNCVAHALHNMISHVMLRMRVYIYRSVMRGYSRL